MRSVLLQWLALWAVMTAVAGAGYWYGAHNRDNAWQALQAKVEHDARALYQAEVQRGQTAALRFLTDKQTLESQYAGLDQKFKALRKRVPLLVPPAVAPAPEATGAGPEPGDGSPARAGPGINVYLRPELSLGAVWMWNSALFGADHPAGTCGADAATAEACAAGSGLTTADAWDNQAINAQSCAADRLRHQRLIDYLNARPATPTQRDQ